MTSGRRRRVLPGLWGLLALAAVLAAAWPLQAMEQSPDEVVLTASDIKRLNVQTIQDLLNLVPGVQADSSTVTIRGSSEVRVLLDGLLLNSTLTAGSTVKWNLVSLPAVASVRIIKGGGSVVHGDDSSGGVIMIATKDLEGDQGYAQASFGGSGIQDHQLGGSLAGPDWGVRGDAGYYHSDGFRLNNDKTIWRLALKSTVTPESWEAERAAGRAAAPSLALNCSRYDRGLPGLPGFPNPQARERQRDFGASAAFTRHGVSSGTFLSNFRNDFSNPPRGLFTELESWTVRQELGGSFAPARLGPFRWGVSLQDSRVRGNQIDAVEEQACGLFATKAVSLEPLPIKLGLGLRQNLYSDFDAALNPEVDLTLVLGTLSLRAGVVCSNNVPTFLQRYYRSSSTEPNPGLDLERGVNYTLGASFRPSPRWQAEATLFYNTVRDRITFILGDQGVGRYENVGEALLDGLDLALTCRPARWLRVQMSYGYLEAKDQTTDLWLPGKPRHTARLDAQFIPTLSSQFGVKVNGCSQAYTRADNSQSAPGYATVDLRAEHLVGPFRIFGKLDNALDEDYLTGDGYPGPPRTWQLGIIWNF